MPVNTNILTTSTLPTIPLEKLYVADSESGNNSDNPELRRDLLTKKSHIEGDLTPMIRIEEFMFSHMDILHMELNEVGFTPTIKVTLVDKTGVFGSAYYPKNKPVLNLYIRSKGEKYKPIRNDYLITKIVSSGSGLSEGGTEGVNAQYTIMGVLLIPKLYNIISKSYNGTSREVLETIAGENQLGFATNEETTSDNMTWLNVREPSYKFINDIVNHAYKDDESFYLSFVDKYYNLNFVNMASMIVDSDLNLSNSWPSIVGFADYLKGDAANDQGQEPATAVPLILTNFTGLSGSELFISDIVPSTNQGNTLISTGINHAFQTYDPFFSDNLKENFIEYNITKFNSTELENEDLKKLTNYYWQGIDYGNNHSNYLFAFNNNFSKLLELYKNTLRVTTEGVNLNVHRGMRIPLVMLREGDAYSNYKSRVKEEEIEGEDAETVKVEEEAQVRVDRFLTDFYVITEIRYIYDVFRSNSRNNFYTEMVLNKKVWKGAPKLLL